MNLDEQGNDEKLEAALSDFRASVRGWSDREFSRTRAVEMAPVRVGFWSRMRTPIAGWALGCAMAVTAVGVPVTVHHQRVVAEARMEADKARLKQAQQQELQARADAMSDDELMSHVDSDIAQATPDAMEPLASMMLEASSSRSSSSQGSGK